MSDYDSPPVAYVGEGGLMATTGEISPATFRRVLEIARAALTGLESITISARYGLPIPMDRIVGFCEAVETARAELDALEQFSAGDVGAHVH